MLSTIPRLLERAQAQASRYENHRYLAKPLDLETLLEAIREMIGTTWVAGGAAIENA